MVTKEQKAVTMEQQVASNIQDALRFHGDDVLVDPSILCSPQNSQQKYFEDRRLTQVISILCRKLHETP